MPQNNAWYLYKANFPFNAIPLTFLYPCVLMYHCLSLKQIHPSSVPPQPSCTHQVIIMGSVLFILGLANKEVQI
ncbi:unnamed protein product [Boreogadus saida]